MKKRLRKKQSHLVKLWLAEHKEHQLIVPHIQVHTVTPVTLSATVQMSESAFQVGVNAMDNVKHSLARAIADSEEFINLIDIEDMPDCQSPWYRTFRGTVKILPPEPN